MKLLLFVCICCLACGQAQKSGNDAAIQTIDSTTQRTPATNPARQAATSLPANKLIVPGKSIGKTPLGTNASQLESLLGNPDVSDAAMGKEWLTWKGKKEDNSTELDIYVTYKDSTMQEKTVQQIRTTSSFFSTAGGAKVGDSFATVRTLFPGIAKTTYYTDGGRTVVVYDDKAEGIAFETAIFGDHEICTGIIIHKKEADVMDIYLTLHPGM